MHRTVAGRPSVDVGVRVRVREAGLDDDTTAIVGSALLVAGVPAALRCRRLAQVGIEVVPEAVDVITTTTSPALKRVGHTARLRRWTPTCQLKHISTDL